MSGKRRRSTCRKDAVKAKPYLHQVLRAATTCARCLHGQAGEREKGKRSWLLPQILSAARLGFVARAERRGTTKHLPVLAQGCFAAPFCCTFSVFLTKEGGPESSRGLSERRVDWIGR